MSLAAAAAISVGGGARNGAAGRQRVPGGPTSSELSPSGRLAGCRPTPSCAIAVLAHVFAIVAVRRARAGRRCSRLAWAPRCTASTTAVGTTVQAERVGRARRADRRDRAELSIVMPVYSEGEAAEPVLRALTAGVTTPTTRSSSSTTSTRTRPSPSSTASTPSCRRSAACATTSGGACSTRCKAGIAASTGEYVLISMADGSDEPHVVDPMVELARGGADVVAASRYMKGGHQVGGPSGQAAAEPDGRAHAPLVRRRRDPRPDEQLQALLAPVPRRDDDRERGRVRARPRADGQGDARPPTRRRGPHDVARPDRRPEQLQAPQVAAALPALVLDRDACAPHPAAAAAASVLITVLRGTSSSRVISPTGARRASAAALPIARISTACGRSRSGLSCSPTRSGRGSATAATSG